MRTGRTQNPRRSQIDISTSACSAGSACLLVLVLALCGCRARAEDPKPPAPRNVVWHKLGSWSGHGSRQTESFTSDTGALRIQWETTHEPAPGRGRFHLTAHSAISGRILQEVVDTKGAGSGTGYVQQDPHVFYMVIDSDGLDWAFTVDEATVYR